LIRSPLLSSVRGFGHAHSTRGDGAVGPTKLAGTAPARAALVRAAGGDPAALCVPEQVHGARVALAQTVASLHPATDALVTDRPGVPLFVQGADCPLVALAADGARVAAVAHSGWRGTVARVAPLAVAAMRELGAPPERIAAAVFPGIGPCCFEVETDVESAFTAAFGSRALAWFAPGKAPEKRLLDLHAAIVASLADAGVPRERIDVVRGCTSCGGEFFSHRASRGGSERHGLCVVLS
jgi:YfiH family protein